ESRVFVFDEPTAGVDVGAKQEIYTRIAKLAEGGAGVIVISSELEEVVGLCHRVLVMREGRCVRVLKGDAISEAAILELCYAAYGLPRAVFRLVFEIHRLPELTHEQFAERYRQHGPLVRRFPGVVRYTQCLVT